jgi:medium-chain acyl-[acyl-carrier-protein] hydrolase
MNAKRLLLPLRKNRNAVLRILFFPYAGGPPTFAYPWAKLLPDNFELVGVRYPRDVDGPELLPQTPQMIADRVHAELFDQIGLPVILLGYSLGALIAYETSIRLANADRNAPAALIVAAAPAPQLPRTRPPIAELSDSDFIAKLRDFGGTPESVLQEPVVMDFFLAGLRADFTTAERYRFTETAPLNCPIAAIEGLADKMVSSTAIAAWKMRTANSFSLHQIAGGHFFASEQPVAVASIVRDLAERFVAFPR